MTEAQDAPAGLHWTGHPLVDMGVAGLTVFAEKRRPEDVTEAHLEAFSSWAKTAYFTKELTAWISIVFGTNFLNPSWKPEEKREFLSRILESYRDTVLDGVHCAIFDRSAQRMVARDLMPMLTGRGLTNFFADGQPGLPVSGLAIVALQGLSVAAPNVGGRLLVVAADDPRLLLLLVRRWQRELRNRAQRSEITGEKQPGWSGPRSRLVEALIQIELERDRIHDPDANYQGSATIYHASNSGQGPDVSIYALELPALRFVRRAQNVKYRDAWQRLTTSAWREADKKDKDAQYARRNDVYEAVFSLPLEAPWFVRRFFCRPVLGSLRGAKPVAGKTRKKKIKADSRPLLTPSSPVTPTPLWGLLEMFLEEVIGMERARIEGIRALGDRLAGLIQTENDRRLFQRVYTARKAFEVRNLLIQLSMKLLKDGLEPALRLNEYLTIFEEGEELARADFGLAWDLTRVRVIEALYDLKWFDGNHEVLEELPIEEGEEER